MTGDAKLRLLIVMAGGAASALPEAWRSYGLVENARASALEALRSPHVLRVAIVEDGSRLGGSVNPLRFVEWVRQRRQHGRYVKRRTLSNQVCAVPSPQDLPGP